MPATKSQTLQPADGMCKKIDGKNWGKVKDTQKRMMQAAGVKKVELHGCIGNGGRCKHIYGPVDRRRACPECTYSRYKANGTTANEIVYYFPLRPRLQALLKSESFLRLLQVSSCIHIYIYYILYMHRHYICVYVYHKCVCACLSVRT